MSDGSAAGHWASLSSRSMSGGDEDDEWAILPIAVFDLVRVQKQIICFCFLFTPLTEEHPETRFKTSRENPAFVFGRYSLYKIDIDRQSFC
jgi:hypothetical protein